MEQAINMYTNMIYTVLISSTIIVVIAVIATIILGIYRKKNGRIVCAKCGTKIDKDSIYCKHCGMKIAGRL